MKILLATDVYTPMINGVVVSVQNLYEQLKAKGHDVRILTLSENRSSRIEGDIYFVGSLPVMIYPKTRMTAKPIHPYVRELIRWKPDIIHTHTEFTTYIHARFIAGRTQAPMVHTYHTLYEDYTHYLFPSRRIGKKAVVMMTRFVLSRAEEVIVPTNKVMGVLKSYGVRRAIVEIPTGIKLERFEKDLEPEERSTMGKTWGIEPSDRVILTVGRLGREKNIHELLERLKPIFDQGEKIIFLIVGDGPAREELEARVRELGLEEHVRFTGMVSPEKISSYYHLGELFISASTSETQGLTYIEAMASGLPLVVKQDECLKGVVDEGSNGYTFMGQEDFEEHLLDLLKDRDKLKKFQEKARVKARSYSEEAFGNQVEALYQRVMESHRRSG